MSRSGIPSAAAVGRAKFLSEAAKLRSGMAKNAKSAPRRVWQFAMVSLLVILAIFGGSVGVANASRETIPGEFLYPAKLFNEDVRLAFTPDPQDQIALLMQYTSIRVNEMIRLREQDLAIPVSTTVRMENHIRQALILAAGLDDAAMQMALNQIRSRLQEQVTFMGEMGDDGDVLMQQSRQQLQERIQYVDESFGDPELFRQQMRVGQEDNSTSDPTDPVSTPSSDDSGKGPGAPGGSDGAPGPEKTPVNTPGSGEGPGPSGTDEWSRRSPGWCV